MMTTIARTFTGRGAYEETANQWTHGIATVAAVYAAFELVEAVRGHADSWALLGVHVYATSLVALYAASTLSHSFRLPRPRHFFRTVDQVCIFLLIVGTFTPVALVYLRDAFGLAILGAMWTLALVGIGLKLFVTGIRNVAVPFYVAVGWLPIVTLPRLFSSMDEISLAATLAGGLFYTSGTYFLSIDRRVSYAHAVWHLFVVAGSACHYVVIFRNVVPVG
ncbi:MAG: hemolysin III family protein [Planctomycetaceae bacterium]